MLLSLGNMLETLDELETNTIVLIEASHFKKKWKYTIKTGYGSTMKEMCTILNTLPA